MNTRKNKVGKTKGNRETKWSHHDDMLVNLKDWVSREITSLREAIGKELPEMGADPAIAKSFKSAEDLSVRLFELLDSMVDVAERESNKKKKASPPPQPSAN